MRQGRVLAVAGWQGAAVEGKGLLAASGQTDALEVGADGGRLGESGWRPVWRPVSSEFACGELPGGTRAASFPMNS